MKKKKQHRAASWLVRVRSHFEEYRTEHTTAIAFVIIFITPMIALWFSAKFEVVHPGLGVILSR